MPYIYMHYNCNNEWRESLQKEEIYVVFAIVLGHDVKLSFFVAHKPSIERIVSMLKEFEDWLFKKCPWYYLISQKQEDEYFSQWFDEVYSKGKESVEHEEMVQKHNND